MLIDTLDIVQSNSVRKRITSGPTQERYIVDWANTLQSAGWSTKASLYATVTVQFPLGAPVTDGNTVLPKTVVGCAPNPGFLTIGNVQYTLYDPYKQVPGTSLACAFVAEGLDSGSTFANLQETIIDSGVWVAVFVYNGGTSYTLTLTATSPGPLFNEIPISGDGRYLAGGAVTHGGGYTMLSSGASTSAQYECTMIAADRGGAGDDYLAGILQFNFKIAGVTVTYQLLDAFQGTLGFMGALGVGGVPQYTTIANPYGFAVFAEPNDPNTHIFRTVSLFCMAPYFPTTDVPSSEVFIPANAVFIVGPNAVGGAPSWRIQSGSTVALNSLPFSTFAFNPTARALSLRSPTKPLNTLYSVPIYVGAYVQFGDTNSNTGPAWVVGKIWDCAIVSDFVSEGASLDGRDFLAIGFSDGSDRQTYCTFMMDGASFGEYPPIGQSARCASAPGNPGSSNLGNTAR
jgi:hypothetical protein